MPPRMCLECLPALIVDAHFVVLATCVRGTAHLAESIDAQFTWQTVAVAVTDLHAYAVLTTFPLRTVVLLAALALTESRYTHVLARTILRSVANIRHSDAALLRRGVPMEAQWAGTDRCVICATADSIWTADILSATRI